MSELRAIVEAARGLRAAGEAFVSAAVVRVHGSAYRRPGARMLATADQWVAGSISGGCLEREVTARGFWRTREAPAVLVTYDEAEDALDERSGSGCQGVVEMLLERHASGPASEGDWFELADACLRDETVGAAVTVFCSRRPDVPPGTRVTLRGEHHACTSDSDWVRARLVPEARSALRAPRRPYVLSCDGGDVEALVECVVPPIHLFVFGAGHDAAPLVAMAKQLGWSVSVWDALPRPSARERLRDADHYLTTSLEHAVAALDRAVQPAAVVMAHHLEHDRRSLAALLSSRASYIGVLGPRRRSQQLLADCEAQGIELGTELRSRVYAPVGLRLGAETPAEIAMAIVAEVQSVLCGVDARALRGAPGAIHAGAAFELPERLEPHGVPEVALQ